MKRILSISILALFLVFTPALAQKLTFHKDGSFKIVQFTDVHWIPDSVGTELAADNMNAILDAEKPDLVIYTGDLVFGEPAKVALDRALEPVITRHIPFAVTFGNHDDEHLMTRQELYEYMKNKPLNLTSTTPGISGVTNYILPIQSSKTGKDAFTLYIMDSNSYSDLKQVKGYGWMKPDQVEWYRQNARRIKQEHQGDTIPAMAFFHIPFPEYLEASQDASARLQGYRTERVCSPEINTGLFSAMLLEGDVLGTFVGHDHDNDYSVLWKGMLLSYGRYSGGKTVYNNLPGGNGARVIELQEGKRSFKTYVRLKTGAIQNVIQYPTDLNW